MMTYRYVEPEVSGSLGDGTDLDSSVHPPAVNRLEFRFDGWLGDCLVESFPCFVLTESAKVAVETSKLSGVIFDDLVVSRSDQFNELYPGKELPAFFWAKVTGIAGRDDFGLAQDFRLVLSERALKVLEGFGLEQALIADYP